MSNDVFNRDVSNLGGVFTSDRAKLFLTEERGSSNLAVLVQQLSTQYQQQITRLYEVGGNNIYYVGGRTQGQMSLQRVIGPSGTIRALYAKYGDVCKAKGNMLQLRMDETDCSEGGQGGSEHFTAKFCVITSIGFAVTAQDMIINETTQMMFGSLESDGTGGNA